MPTNKQPASEPDPSHTFSLATMLLLTTVVAIFMAAARVFITGQQTIKADEAAWRAIVGAGIGLFVGATIAFRRRRWGFGLALAVLIGPLVGGAAAVLMAEPRNLSVVLVGSAVLVLFGLVVRKLSHTPVE